MNGQNEHTPNSHTPPCILRLAVFSRRFSFCLKALVCLIMAGIIHPCVHPEGRPAPKTQTEMFQVNNILVSQISFSNNEIKQRRINQKSRRRRKKKKKKAEESIKPTGGTLRQQFNQTNQSNITQVSLPPSQKQSWPSPSQAIFDYIDRIVAAVRPRKVLFLAVDGPAPRAKLNQQRSRRFKSSKDRVERLQVEARVRSEWLEKGGEEAGLLPPKESACEGSFDSNVITPGHPPDLEFLNSSFDSNVITPWI